MGGHSVQILCGECGRTSEIEDHLADKDLVCPHCGREMASFTEKAAPPRYSPQEYDHADEGGFAGKVHREISRKLVVTCGSCGKNLKSSRRMIGRKVKCPSCNKKILVPAPREEEMPDGTRPRTVGMDLRIADLEPELEEALAVEELPKAELIRRGPPMWVWLALAGALGAIAGIVIWVMAT